MKKISITDRDLSLIASDLRDFNIKEATLELMRRMVNCGFSSRIIAALVDAQLTQDRFHAISIAMKNLEFLAKTDCTLASILMSDLWGFASDERMHDICDAIDLWLWDSRSAEFLRHLKALASSEHDPGKRRHFEQLIAGKRE